MKEGKKKDKATEKEEVAYLLRLFRQTVEMVMASIPHPLKTPTLGFKIENLTIWVFSGSNTQAYIWKF